MLGQPPEVSSPHKNKKFHVICPEMLFEVQPRRSPELNPLDFYLWKRKKSPPFSAPTEYKKTFHQRIFMAVRPFLTAPEPLKGYKSPLSNMPICELIQMGDIFRICCKFRLDEQQKLKNIKSGTRIAKYYVSFK
jgi:hypothetical protein